MANHPSKPVVHHNHVTRDIKPKGKCPACDGYWKQVEDPEGRELVQNIHNRLEQRVELGRLIIGRTVTTAVEAIWAAGYRKPRRITTSEELAELPEGYIVQGDWATYQLILGTWATIGSPAVVEPQLPATVLHEGAAK